ncbi:hypothetical protein PTI98_000843 [Pleurotus ostreatus]|nr:hypothetical protein PTI98_000843 [Pleurotus ostreatus]
MDTTLTRSSSFFFTEQPWFLLGFSPTTITMYFSSLVTLAVLFGAAAAVPTPAEHSLVARDCSAEVRRFNIERREKRGLGKRAFYNSIKNATCIVSPDAPRVNYVANPAVRTDVTDGQTGIALTLDVGVMDITTCQPLTNTMVEVWSANAQGNYGSYLRGATATSSSGIAEFQTIFPGYSSDGANHINLLVHQQSLGSPVTHVGQVFFTDRWTEVVSMTSPYNTNTHKLTKNAQDPNYTKASSSGYSPIVDIESINDDWPEGVVGYITVGVNPSKSV